MKTYRVVLPLALALAINVLIASTLSTSIGSTAALQPASAASRVTGRLVRDMQQIYSMSRVYPRSRRIYPQG